mmetsp:Transcript_1052/g.2066  ORF Transcript_1052/g.2066 Transcript_1052/m.2066 type:complete len:294 (+) Transcript_1052:128-1009(+)
MKWENNANGSFWKLRFEQLSSRKSLKRKVAHGKGGLKQCNSSESAAITSAPFASASRPEGEVFLNKVPRPVTMLLLTQFNTNDFEALFQAKCRPVLVDGQQPSTVTELFMFHWGVDITQSDNCLDDRWMKNPVLSRTAVQTLFTVGALAFDYLVSKGCLSGKMEDYDFVPGLEKTINIQKHPDMYRIARDENNNNDSSSSSSNNNNSITAGRNIFSILLPLHVEGSLLRLGSLETGEQRFLYVPFGKFVIFDNTRYTCGHGYGQSGNRCILGLIIPKQQQQEQQEKQALQISQ